MVRPLIAVLAILALPLGASANAVVVSLKGEVKADNAPALQDQRLFAGARISTGPDAQALLRFDDGMQVVLNENTRLEIVDFTFATGRLKDRAVLELQQGAARIATGSIAAKNPREFFVRTKQAQFGVQGPADFTIALVNPAYVTVIQGTVLATNTAGTVAMAAGSNFVVATNAALATPAALSSFPAVASSATANLAAASVAPAGGVAAGAVATAGAATGLGITTPVLFIGAAAAAAAGAFNRGDGTPATVHH